MNGNSVVLDTNIVLYLLNGDQILSELLYQKKLYLSFISQLELLGYKGISAKQQLQVSKFIQECVVIDINEEIKTEAIQIRKQTKLKLPDTIVLATARFLSLPLITSDQDFKEIESPEIIIYE
ncbi:MAG: type II toxin-antitoxin system VapC family toxin [Bacteroidetes bacterium]|nr:type II toxin-antitoxin system VapC family toxin [Bacteroidota bacterium]